MRRADRLFQIVQLLRGRRVVTAAELAESLEVSLRTIYRDVRDLVASGVPIEGEAGVGYLLPRGFDLPPLMFDEDELDALVLGARMVQAWSDPELARHARRLLGKVEAVLPDRLRPKLEDVALFSPGRPPSERVAKLDPLRRAANEKRKIRLAYVDASGRTTSRVIRPICLTFWGSTWLASAWCELREDFRSFRPDRMEAVELLDERFEDEPGRDLTALLERVSREAGSSAGQGAAVPAPSPGGPSSRGRASRARSTRPSGSAPAAELPGAGP